MGNSFFVANDVGLSRYSGQRDGLTREDVSFRIGGNNTRRICFSNDSKFVAMPAGGGNGAGHANHPPLKTYATYIYPVTDLKRPITGFAPGAYPRAVGIDPKSGCILAQSASKPLIIYSFSGDAKLGEYDFKLFKGNTTTTEFAISPLGSEAIARTEAHGIVHIKINKGGTPIGRLEPNLIQPRRPDATLVSLHVFLEPALPHRRLP